MAINCFIWLKNGTEQITGVLLSNKLTRKCSLQESLSEFSVLPSHHFSLLQDQVDSTIASNVSLTE